MIDLAKLEPVLGGYQTYFPKHWPHVEDFKWEAAQHFHDHWNIDAADFGEMFKEATAKVFSLLDTGYAYPRAMILNFAAADCEATRAMFRSLFDESTELSQRIIAFQAATEEIRTKYNDGSWNNHYQNTSAISVYLWLRYPDQYYIYRYSVARDISDALNFDAPPKRDGSVESLLNSYRLYDELRVALSQNAAITQMIRSAIEAAPAGKYWPDTHWNIAAIDLGFYLSRFYLAEQKTSQMQAGWFPAESEYDPGITTAQWSALLQDTSVFTSEALRVMKCMLDYGGQATCKQLAIKYGETSNFYISNSYHLAQRVAEKTGCRCMPRDSENMRWWPILYVGKSTKADGTYIWRLRDELLQALKKADLSKVPAAAATCEAPSRHYWWLTANPKIWSYSSLRVGEEQTYTLYNDNGNKRRIFQNFLDAKAGDLVIGYDEPLSRPLNLVMERGQKAVLVGANGIGKTTLLKSILGLTPALSGSVELGDYLSIGYFEQEMAPGNTNTCLDEIWKEFPSYTQYQVRSALAKCGLTTKHIESQVRVLSGGEQAKVRLCKLINRESNVLLLDEPTNHLDVDAKAELKRALKEYKGSILLICHEPEFYEGLATDIWDCRDWALRLS